MKITSHPIKFINFNTKNFYKARTNKTMVVLHGTGSGGSAKAVADYWNTLETKIATHIIIERDGTPVQLYNSKFWAYHLGLDLNDFKKFNLPNRNMKLNLSSIAIEFINWNHLELKDNKFYSWTNKKVLKKDVITYPEKFSGYNNCP